MSKYNIWLLSRVVSVTLVAAGITLSILGAITESSLLYLMAIAALNLGDILGSDK